MRPVSLALELYTYMLLLYVIFSWVPRPPDALARSCSVSRGSWSRSPHRCAGDPAAPPRHGRARPVDPRAAHRVRVLRGVAIEASGSDRSRLGDVSDGPAPTMAVRRTEAGRVLQWVVAVAVDGVQPQVAGTSSGPSRSACRTCTAS
jgi:hypothetical protein